jgi:outer membrane protein assembly factor BamD (BamD/ComL family)
LAEIPTTDEAKVVIKNQLEKGLFDLAKMYSLTKELPKAQATFLRLVGEFPTSKYAPEALYSLSRLCKETKGCDAEKYQQQLKEKHPTSNYAQSMDNKDFFKETKVQDSVVNRKYEQTYALYQAEQYPQALTSLQNLEKEHPNSHLSDKLELLNAMLMLKTTSNLLAVQEMILKFLEKNKDSDLEPLAQSILDNIKKKTTGGN